MKDERKAREAMHECVRLVVILNDEDWRTPTTTRTGLSALRWSSSPP